MSDDPHPDQTLPGDLPDDEPDKEEPPRGPGQNRGRDEEARAKAPGQVKKDDDDE